MYKVALDVMGGDYAPGEIVYGAYLAAREYHVQVILVGPQDILEKEVELYKNWPENSYCIINASEVVGMSESPSVSFRKKKRSSIRVGLGLVKDKMAEAFVSAGNTGAVMAASTLILGKLPDIERPAIATVLPSKNNPVVMLDVGSNVDCKASYLNQFASMGHCMAQAVLRINNPRVGLLNIGEEVEKGNALTQKAFELIKDQPINFVGNVEGKDILSGAVDVAVCDGFVGNALLKFGEGAADLFFDFFKNESKSSKRSLLGLMLLKKSLKKFKKRFDHEEYGGAPLLGINGVSIVAHGSSSAVAVKNAVRNAIRAVENNMVYRIEGAIHR
ncbi:MAG: phosphate acyltransferase PlsX [bacterium]|nr:phosphate acyltransferase PlsX [bacterium]